MLRWFLNAEHNGQFYDCILSEKTQTSWKKDAHVPKLRLDRWSVRYAQTSVNYFQEQPQFKIESCDSETSWTTIHSEIKSRTRKISMTNRRFHHNVNSSELKIQEMHLIVGRPHPHHTISQSFHILCSLLIRHLSKMISTVRALEEMRHIAPAEIFHEARLSSIIM